MNLIETTVGNLLRLNRRDPDKHRRWVRKKYMFPLLYSGQDLKTSLMVPQYLLEGDD